MGGTILPIALPLLRIHRSLDTPGLHIPKEINSMSQIPLPLRTPTTQPGITGPKYQAPELKVMRLNEHPVDWRKLETPGQAESIWRNTVEQSNWYDADKECIVVFLLSCRRHLL